MKAVRLRLPFLISHIDLNYMDENAFQSLGMQEEHSTGVINSIYNRNCKIFTNKK